MTLLGDPDELTDLAVAKLRANRVTLGIADDEDIYYGDRMNIPQVPAITIEVPDVQYTQTNFGATDVDFTGLLFVYYAHVDSTSTVKKEADQYAKSVRAVMNSDPQFKDGSGEQQVLWAFINRIESNYAKRAGGLFYASRLTWQGRSRQFP